MNIFQCGLILLLAAQCSAQITPHSALKDFKLPKYNENSYREYTLSGDEGIYDQKGNVIVKAAVLTLYSGDEQQILKTTITTNLANFDLKNNFATGDSIIEIKDSDFYLKGKGWTLDMEEKKITIEKEGTIRFYESIELDIDQVFE